MTYALGVQELSIRKRVQTPKTVFEGDFGKVSEMLAGTQSRLSAALRKSGLDAGAILWEAFSELNQRFWDQFFAGKRAKTNDWRPLLEEQELRIKELKEQLKAVEGEKDKAVECLQAKEMMVDRLEKVINTAQTDPSSLRTSVSSGKLVKRKSKIEREIDPREIAESIYRSHDSATAPPRSFLEGSQKFSRTMHESRSPGDRKPASTSSSMANVDFKGLKEQLDLVTQERNQLQDLIRPRSPSHHLEALELEHTEEKRRLRSVISDLRRQLSDTKAEDAVPSKAKAVVKSPEDYLRLEKERSQAFFKALKTKENECVEHLASSALLQEQLEIVKTEHEKSLSQVADLKRRDEQAEKILLKAQADLDRTGSLLKTLREEKDGQVMEIKQIRAANGVLDVKNRRFAGKIEELERLLSDKAKELADIQEKIQEIDELKPEFESVFKLKSELENVTNERDDYLEETQTLKESLEFYRSQLEATTKTLEEMRLEEDIGKKSEAEKMVKSVQDQIQRHVQALEKRVRDTEERLHSVQDEFDRIKKKSDFVEKRRAETEKLTNEMNAKTKKVLELEQMVERLKSELEGNSQDFEERMALKSSDLDQLQTKLSVSDSLLAELKTKALRQESEKRASSELLERLKTDNKHQEKEIEKLQSAYSEAESALSDAQKSLFFHESTAEKTHEELTSQKTTIRTLEDKTQSMEKLNADLMEELKTLKQTQETGAEKEKLGWKKTEDALREQIRKLKTEKMNAELSAEGKEHDLEQLREDLKAASGSKDVSLEREQVALSQLERFHTSESVEKQRFREENRSLIDQIRSLNSALDTLTRDHEVTLQIEHKRFEEIRLKNATLETTKTGLEREVLDLKDNALAATQKVHSLQQELKSRKADFVHIRAEGEHLDRISALEKSLETRKSENEELRNELEQLRERKEAEITGEHEEDAKRVATLEQELVQMRREKDALALKFERANSDLEDKVRMITELCSAAGASGLDAFHKAIKLWVGTTEELTELYSDIGDKLESPSVPSVSAYIHSIETRLFQGSHDLETQRLSFQAQISDLSSESAKRKELAVKTEAKSVLLSQANSELSHELSLLKSNLRDQTQEYEGIIDDLSRKSEELEKKAMESESQRAETAKKLEKVTLKRAEMAENLKKVLQEVQTRSDTLEREKEELSLHILEATEENESREKVIRKLNADLNAMKDTLEKNQKMLKMGEIERNSLSQTIEKLTKTHLAESLQGKTALERTEAERFRLESELETLKAELSAKSTGFEELKTDHFRLVTEYKRISDLFSGQSGSPGDLHSMITEERDRLLGENRVYREAENRVKSEIEALRQELKTAQRTLLETENSRKRLETDLEEKRTEIDGMERSISAGKRDLEAAMAEIRTKERTITKLEIEGNEGKEALIRMQEDSQRENSSLRSENEELESRILTVAKDMEALRIKCQKVSEDLLKSTQNVALKTAEISSLKDLQVKYEGEIAALQRKLSTAEDLQLILEERVTHLQNEVEEGKQRESALQIESKSVLNDVEKQLKTELNKTMEALRLSHRKEEGLSTELEQEKKAKARIQEEIMESHNQMTRTQEELEHRNEEIREFHTKTADLETRIHTFSQENGALEAKNQNLAKELAESIEKLRSESDHISTLQTNLKAAQAKISDQTDQLTTSIHVQNGLKSTISRLQSDSEVQQQREVVLDTELKSVKAEIREIEDSYKERLAVKERREGELTTEQEERETALRLLQQKVTGMNKEIDIQLKEIERRKGENFDLETKCKESNGRISQLTRDIEYSKLESLQLAAELKKLTNDLATKTDQIASLKTTLDSVELAHREVVSDLGKRLNTAEDHQRTLERTILELENTVEEGKQRESALQIESKSVLNDVEKQLKTELNKTMEALRLSHRKEEGLSAELEQEKKAKVRIQEEIIESRNQLTRTQEELEHRNEEIREFQSKTADLEARIQTFSQESEMMKARFSTLQIEQQSLREDMTKTNAVLLSKSRQIESMETAQSKHVEAVSALNTHIQKLTKDLEDGKQRETALEIASKTVKTDSERLIKDLNQELATAKVQLQTEKEEIRRLSELCESAETAKLRLEKEVDYLNEEVADLITKVKELSAENEDLQHANLHQGLKTPDFSDFDPETGVLDARIPSFSDAIGDDQEVEVETGAMIHPREIPLAAGIPNVHEIELSTERESMMDDEPQFPVIVTSKSEDEASKEEIRKLAMWILDSMSKTTENVDIFASKTDLIFERCGKLCEELTRTRTELRKIRTEFAKLKLRISSRKDEKEEDEVSNPEAPIPLFAQEAAEFALCLQVQYDGKVWTLLKTVNKDYFWQEGRLQTDSNARLTIITESILSQINSLEVQNRHLTERNAELEETSALKSEELGEIQSMLVSRGFNFQGQTLLTVIKSIILPQRRGPGSNKARSGKDIQPSREVIDVPLDDSEPAETPDKTGNQRAMTSPHGNSEKLSDSGNSMALSEAESQSLFKTIAKLRQENDELLKEIEDAHRQTFFYKARLSEVQNQPSDPVSSSQLSVIVTSLVEGLTPQ